MSQNPTENLRRGRRRIEEIPEIILLKDWTWDVVTKRFYLHIRVCLDHDGKDIPGNVKKCAVGRHPKSEMLTICAC